MHNSIRRARRGVIRLLTSMTGACDLFAGPIFRLDIITLWLDRAELIWKQGPMLRLYGIQYS